MVKKEGSLYLTGRNASLFATSRTKRSVTSPSFFRSYTLDGDTADLKKCAQPEVLGPETKLNLYIISEQTEYTN